MKKKKDRVYFNYRELVKQSGLYEFRCPECGHILLGSIAIRTFFLLLLDKLASGMDIKIPYFGSFCVRVWKPPKIMGVDKVHRIYFRPFYSAKKYVATKVKELENAKGK